MRYSIENFSLFGESEEVIKSTIKSIVDLVENNNVVEISFSKTIDTETLARLNYEISNYTVIDNGNEDFKRVPKYNFILISDVDDNGKNYRLKIVISKKE